MTLAGGDIVVIGGSPCTDVSLFNRQPRAKEHSFNTGESAHFHRMANFINAMSRKKIQIENEELKKKLKQQERQ